jgi:diguanylate cyclase (GGDEF)-like protein/PAS domain S-box-containing protein
MRDPRKAPPGQDDAAFLKEIIRLNKMVEALMNRAERSTSAQGSDFSLFQTAVTLEDQVRRRTVDLEAALLENEKIARAMQLARQRMELEIDERQRAQQALHQSEERHRIATEAALDVFITIDEHNTIMFVNAAAEKVFGYAPADILGKDMGMLVPDRLRMRHLHGMQEYLRTGRKKLSWQGVQIPCLHKDGREVPLEFSFGEFEQNGKRFFTGIARDITERKRAEALRDSQQRVLEMIALDAPLEDTLQSLLCSVEDQCEGMLCSVLLLDDGGSHVAAGISSSLDPAYLDALVGFAIGPCAGSCGTAMFRGEPVMVADIETDSLWEAYRALVAPYGLRACWSTPIFSGSGKVLGAFAMYYREPRMPQDAEQRLIDLAVRMAGIAIERQRHEAYIRHIAHHDPLTGLPNRILLEDRLRQSIAQANRCGRRVAVLFIDLDHFKHINDSLGHHIGDSLLQQAAQRMQACLREVDSVARLGGDEFVICLADVHQNGDATAVAEKLQAALAQPFSIEGHALRVGSSIGISLYPLDGAGVEELMRAADAAMYDAKAKGRGNYQFFTPELNIAAQQRLTVSNELRQALAHGELMVHYQPQISMATGAIIGAEALLRWEHPAMGLVPPVQFIPILEEIGMMGEIGKWVLHTACAQNLAWQAEGLPPLRMAVNLSARQFYGGNIVGTVAEVLHETGLSAKWLELELTESLILDNSESVIEAMRALKGMGISLSLDDFGTGYSSLSYLRRFPVNRLKIDRSFIKDITCDTGSADIVRSILALAQRLGLGAIAEGVETAAQYGYLQKHGCPEMQGYLYSAAMPAQKMTEMLRTDRRLAVWSRISNAAHTLLIVDEDDDVRAALKQSLVKEGLNVLDACNADQALDILAQHNVGVVMADLWMGGRSGVELLSKIKSLYPETTRMLLTGSAEIGSVVNAINKGAIYKIVMKPWDDQEVIGAVRDAFAAHVMRRESMATPDG